MLLKLKQSKKRYKINWKKHPSPRNQLRMFSNRSRTKLRSRLTKHSKKLRKLKTSVLLRNLLLRLFKTRLTNLFKERPPFNLKKFLFLRISSKLTLSLKNSLALCSQHLSNWQTRLNKYKFPKLSRSTKRTTKKLQSSFQQLVILPTNTHKMFLPVELHAQLSNHLK